jgi:hypothetical protein
VYGLHACSPFEQVAHLQPIEPGLGECCRVLNFLKLVAQVLMLVLVQQAHKDTKVRYKCLQFRGHSGQAARNCAPLGELLEEVSTQIVVLLLDEHSLLQRYKTWHTRQGYTMCRTQIAWEPLRGMQGVHTPL